jgi:hypothetical protein
MELRAAQLNYTKTELLLFLNLAQRMPEPNVVCAEGKPSMWSDPRECDEATIGCDLSIVHVIDGYDRWLNIHCNGRHVNIKVLPRPDEHLGIKALDRYEGDLAALVYDDVQGVIKRVLLHHYRVIVERLDKRTIHKDWRKGITQ